MSRLISKSPKEVEVDGQKYPLNINFRDCLKTVMAISDEELTSTEKLNIILENTFDKLPYNLEKAVEKALEFLSYGKTEDKPIAEKLCDFEQDGEFIYAAFLKKGVELDKIEDMHWWDFLAHFMELPESQFGRIVYLRSLHQNGKLYDKDHKEERKEAERIGMDIIRLKGEKNARLELEKHLMGES